MQTLSTDRMLCSPESDATDGRVVWVPAKSLWTATLTAIALIFGPLTFTWDALALFVVTTAITICAGHSVGMHRLLIHRAFEAPLWLERTLVYLGTLVGMAGPFGMIYAHDIRDWAQRQRACHDLHAHRRPFFHDAFWQMHCAVALRHPPRFVIEPHVANDRFYQVLEKTWMAQQLPWAVLFFALGGWSWVVWGIAVRVAVSLTGHWLVGHFAHKHGHQGWAVDGVAVQGYNVPFAGFVTFGEAYHGNHHAFPGSANLALDRGQIDLGWHFIRALEYLGLARRIQTPATTGERDGLRRLPERGQHARRARLSDFAGVGVVCDPRDQWPAHSDLRSRHDLPSTPSPNWHRHSQRVGSSENKTRRHSRAAIGEARWRESAGTHDKLLAVSADDHVRSRVFPGITRLQGRNSANSDLQRVLHRARILHRFASPLSRGPS